MLIIQAGAILFLLNIAVLQLVGSKLKSRIFRYEIK
jgi:hypothetical protein